MPAPHAPRTSQPLAREPRACLAGSRQLEDFEIDQVSGGTLEYPPDETVLTPL